jgi:hypothetical protein
VTGATADGSNASREVGNSMTTIAAASAFLILYQESIYSVDAQSLQHSPLTIGGIVHLGY